MEQNENFKGFFKGILILLICIGTIFYRAESNADIAGKSIAYIIGYSLVPAGVFYLLLVVLFKASSNKLVEVATFGALLLGVSVGNYVGMRLPSDGTKPSIGSVNASAGSAAVVKDEITKTYKELYDSGQDENGFAKKSDIVIDTTPRADGENGKLEAFVKEFLKSVQQLQNNYVNAVEDSGMTRLLDPSRVEEPNSYAESVVILSRARMIVERQENAYNALMDSVPDKLRAKGFSKKSEDEFIDAFVRSRARTKDATEELFRLEYDIVKEASAAIDVLEDSRGQWYVENGHFMFNDERAMQQYNTHFRNMQTALERQNVLREKMHQNTLDAFNNIK